MQKPSAKWVIIFNIVLDLPMAIVMSISAALLSHQPLVLIPNLLSNIIIGFILAFLINVILPIPLISALKNFNEEFVSILEGRCAPW